MSRDYFGAARPVSLQEVLDAREARAAAQSRWLLRHGCPLISFTLNIPGEYKCYPLAKAAFSEGVRQIEAALEGSGIAVLERAATMQDTGCEGFFAADGAAQAVKRLMVAIEQTHPIGRFFDMDVLDQNGAILRGEDCGRAPRSCLICGKPAAECARSRAHSPEQLALHTAQQFDSFFMRRCADEAAGMAVHALLFEVAVTPKPGLVDRANSGAHSDMNFFHFLSSGSVLTPYFRDITQAAYRFEGAAQAMLPKLRSLGIAAEREMLRSTRGVNTHKGLIFSMGIVCAALGYLRGRATDVTEQTLFACCADIARGTERELSQGGDSYGKAAYRNHNITGARGEAAAGFPAVRQHGYPVLKERLARGDSPNDAGVAALMALMAHVDDTNVIHRAGLAALRDLQKSAREALAASKDTAQLLAAAARMDSALIAANISPGGSADLLAVSFLVHDILQRAEQ